MVALNLRKSVVQRYWELKNKKFADLCEVVEENEHWCVDDNKDVEIDRRMLRYLW